MIKNVENSASAPLNNDVQFAITLEEGGFLTKLTYRFRIAIPKKAVLHPTACLVEPAEFPNLINEDFKNPHENWALSVSNNQNYELHEKAGLIFSVWFPLLEKWEVCRFNFGLELAKTRQ